MVLLAASLAAACSSPGGAPGDVVGASPEQVGAVSEQGTPPSPVPSEASGRDVVVLSIDTLRADRLSTWGYARQTSPQLTALAASSTRFTKAHSVSSWTLPSLASLFTGLRPSQHGLSEPDEALSPEVRTLAEEALELGYETAFFGVNPRLPSGHGLEQGFGTWEVDAGRAGRAMNQEVRSFLEAREAAGVRAPLLLVVHYFEPHCRYRAPRDVADRFVGDGVIVDERIISLERYESMGDCYRLQQADGSPELRLQTYRDAYDAEVAEVDALVGQLWGWLERREPWLLLMGDHGEAFWEHDDYGHGRDLHSEQVHVPLLVRRPGGGAGELVEGVVDTVHAAALLDAMLQGGPLPASPASDAGRALLETDYGDQRLRSWRGPRGALQVDLDRPHECVRYDLVADPAEVAPEGLEPERCAELVALFETVEQVPSVRQGISEEDRAMLEALGYEGPAERASELGR